MALIKYNNKTVNKLAMDSTVYKVYYGGNLAYLGIHEEEPTPTFDGKWLVETSSASYSGECNDSITLTISEMENYQQATAITIGDCAKSINSSFSLSAATDLVEVKSLGRIRTLTQKMFYYLSKLETIDLSSITSMHNANQCFVRCSALTQVNLSNLSSEIPDSAFQDCKNLTSVTIGVNVSTIAKSAFSNTNLQQINIPSGVTSIDSASFLYTDPNTITVDESNTVYWSENNCLCYNDSGSGTCIFKGCKNSVIPSNIYSIGKQAFVGTAYGPVFEIPTTLEIIYGNAFYECKQLTAITYTNGRNVGLDIGINAFRGCTNLTSVELPPSNMSIFYTAFDYCTSLTSFTINSVSDPFYATSEYSTMDELPCPIKVPCQGWGNYKSNPILSNNTIETIEGTTPQERWIDTEQTICENGNLYRIQEWQWSCDGVNWLSPQHTCTREVLIEEGSSECQATTDVIFNAPQLWAEMGNATSNTFSNGGVTITSNSNTGLRLTGSTSSVANCRVSGRTSNTTIEITTDNDIDIENVTMVANSSGDRGRLSGTSYTFRENYDQTSGTCSINGTTRYWIRYKLKEGGTKQTSIPFEQSGGGTVSFIYIAINVDDSWTDVLPPP